MSTRTTFAMLAAALVAIALVLVGPAAAAPPKLTGTVGPGHTIDLRMNGKKVTRLKAGVSGSYRFFCVPHADEMRGSFRVVR